MSVSCGISDCPRNLDGTCTDDESINIEDMISTIEMTCYFTYFHLDEEAHDNDYGEGTSTD